MARTDSGGAESVAKPPGPAIDIRRAELADKHVRALNVQFASWVQLQLRNHPDELWEDGVKDYLSHASNIVEKFSDVVAWLKTNTLKEENTPASHTSGFSSHQNNFSQGNENVKPSAERQITSMPVFQEKKNTSEPTWHGGNSGLGTLSSDSISTNQNPLLEEDELERPSSPSVRKTEEKGVVVAHEVKCKVYVKPENAAYDGWKDIGMGMLVIKFKEGAAKASKESKPIIVVRNDVGKVLLNASIYPGIKMNIQKNTIASIFHTSSAGVANEELDSNAPVVARPYLLRMKNEDETRKLATIIKEYAPT